MTLYPERVKKIKEDTMKKISIDGLKNLSFELKTTGLDYFILKGDGNSFVFHNQGINSMKLFGYYIIVPIKDFNELPHLDILQKKYPAHHYCPYHGKNLPEADHYYQWHQRNCLSVILHQTLFKKEESVEEKNIIIIKGSICDNKKNKIMIPIRPRYTLEELNKIPDETKNPLGRMKKISDDRRIWISSNNKKIFFEHFEEYDEECQFWVVDDEYNL